VSRQKQQARLSRLCAIEDAVREAFVTRLAGGEEVPVSELRDLVTDKLAEEWGRLTRGGTHSDTGDLEGSRDILTDVAVKQLTPGTHELVRDKGGDWVRVRPAGEGRSGSPPAREPAWVDDLRYLLRLKWGEILCYRDMGEVLNDHFGDPQEDQSADEEIVKPAAEALQLPVSEVSLMRRFAARFPTWKVLKEKHPDLDTWQKVKGFLCSLPLQESRGGEGQMS
jgi:hypothetical protein